MPVIRVDWLEGRTPQQKRDLAHAITRAFVDVAKVAPEQVWIVFQDVPRSDWAIGGTLLNEPPA